MVCFGGKTLFVFLHTAGFHVTLIEKLALVSIGITVMYFTFCVLPQCVHVEVALHNPARLRQRVLEILEQLPDR